MFRATSATDRPPSMTKLTASSLYSSVKLRRVEPISETPDEPGSYPQCPPKRERSNLEGSLPVWRQVVLAPQFRHVVMGGVHGADCEVSVAATCMALGGCAGNGEAG